MTQQQDYICPACGDTAFYTRENRSWIFYQCPKCGNKLAVAQDGTISFWLKDIVEGEEAEPRLHQDHRIVKDEFGWHCQTCADQAATEAARNEVARLLDENERLRRDNIAQLEKAGSAYFNTLR